MPRSDAAIDPILLEVLWNRLISVVNEQAAALMRTSFTSVVREAGDLSAGVFDVRGNMVAQAVTGTPGHINTMATCVRHFLAAYPPERLAPGDVLISNDPWRCSGHLNDLTVVTPTFRDRRLIAFFASTCHSIDIGGRPLSADGREVFEEGLFIPITKLFSAAEPNEELFKLIRANVRAPDLVVGDIYAQVAGNDVGGARLIEFLAEFGLPDIERISDEIVTRSEAAMRDAIATIPDGVYENEVYSDGFDEPILLKARVTVSGDEILVDHAGSSPQSPHGINVVLNYTHAYSTYALKCAVCPEVPNNEGTFRPIRVTAPPGTILHALFPAPVAGRHILGHFLPGLVLGALARAIPDRVIAEGSANIWAPQFRGRDEHGRPFTFIWFCSGGTGARPNKDGLSATAFPSGVAGVAVEVIENTAPLLITRRELLVDSGGPGRFRGGCGQGWTVQVRTKEPFFFSAMSDRTRFPAAGYAGGLPGAAGRVALSGLTERPNPKQQLHLPADTTITLDLPGGGGFGDPSRRDPTTVRRDVVDGLVSLASAERDYGVVIDPLTLAIDEVATARLRPSV